MADLYSRLEEIQGMTRTLIEDVESLLPDLGSRSISDEITDQEKINRRFYVRAIFALIEAVVEQHKQLLLELYKNNFIELKIGFKEALSEQDYFVSDNGNVVIREQYLQLKRKLRLVYKSAEDAFGIKLQIDYGGKGWETFQSALVIRNRTTHPKRYMDCEIDENALEIVESAQEWFREVNNEFVRIARLHRNNNHW